MIVEPRRGIAGKPLAIGERAIVSDDVCAIIGNRVAEGVVTGEGWVLFPVLRQASQAAQRERLHHRCLEPLAGRRPLGVGLPAVGKHMAQFMTELVGELRSVPLADVDYYPRHAAPIRLLPTG